MLQVHTRADLTSVPQVHVCWGDEQDNTVFELTEVLAGPLAGKPVERGSEGYIQLAASTKDVYKCAAELFQHLVGDVRHVDWLVVERLRGLDARSHINSGLQVRQACAANAGHVINRTVRQATCSMPCRRTGAHDQSHTSVASRKALQRLV